MGEENVFYAISASFGLLPHSYSERVLRVISTAVRRSRLIIGAKQGVLIEYNRGQWDAIS